MSSHNSFLIMCGWCPVDDDDDGGKWCVAGGAIYCGHTDTHVSLFMIHHTSHDINWYSLSPTHHIHHFPQIQTQIHLICYIHHLSPVSTHTYTWHDTVVGIWSVEIWSASVTHKHRITQYLYIITIIMLSWAGNLTSHNNHNKVTWYWHHYCNASVTH